MPGFPVSRFQRPRLTVVNRQLLIHIILQFVMHQDKEEAFILATIQKCTLWPIRGRLLATEHSDQSLSSLVTVLCSISSQVTLAGHYHSQRELP